MASLNIGQLPSSLEEVVGLILQLYQPGAHGSVSRIQETLHQLQKSPEGWQLAQNLLENKEESVRFFGALTFIVKLNTDSKSLSEADAHALLLSLMSWLVRCVENGEGALVTRKLCSALVAYFLQFSASWTRCIRHVTYCICLGRAVPYDALDEAPGVHMLVQSISIEKAIVVCWFAATLVEEVSKMDSNSMKQHKFHAGVGPNVDDIVPLIRKYIGDQSAGAHVKIRKEAMKCYQAWVSYSHRAFIDDAFVLEPLQTLTRHAILSLADDDLYEVSSELLADVLSNYSKFLHADDFALLYTLFSSQWAQARYQRLVGGDFDHESMQFGLFMLAFGDAIVLDLARKAGTDLLCQQLLSLLVGLLGAEGFAVSEDKIYVPALEFWTTYVESMIDDAYSVEGGEPPYFDAAQEPIMQAIHKCWRKIQFPSTEEFNSWDSVDRTGFKDARRDVADLLQQFYLIRGISLLNIFIELAQQSIQTGNWTELEASLFCLAQFSDAIKDGKEHDEYMNRIFSSDLFSLFTSQQHIPMRAVHSFLTLIREYSDYFKKHTQHLPAALNVAFGSVGSTMLAKNASSAIVELCSSSRAILVGELNAFLQQFSSLSHASVDGGVKEGVMEGIGSIIQAIDTDAGKIAPIEQLLNFIEADVENCLNLLSSESSSESALNTPDINGSSGIALELGLTALRCLKGMAKGLQVPSDTPVDLEDTAPKSKFWTTGYGAIIQQRIISIMGRVYAALRMNSQIIEEECSVFRSGFREDEPGPFVFESGPVAQFLVQANSKTPRLGLIITTAGLLIKAHKSGDGIEQVFDVLLKWVTRLLQILGEPGYDPEVAQSGIEFLNRFVQHFPSMLLSQDSSSLEYLFMFTLKALTGSDPLPKQSAALFWTSFTSLADHGSTEAVLRELIHNALQQLGPLLAQALVYNFGGNAARSELDRLCEPLKKLVRQLHFKNWFEAALLADSFPSDKVTDEDKSVFLQKIINLRGTKATNQVVREFWLASRGSNFAYAT